MADLSASFNPDLIATNSDAASSALAEANAASTAAAAASSKIAAQSAAWEAGITAAANLTANALIVGEDGAKGVKAAPAGIWAEINILVDTTPAADVAANGIKGVFTNGNAGAVAFGDVCYMAADGHLEFADADQITTMPGLYMALGTINAAASGEWLLMGIARNDAWNWTIGAGTLGLIYVSVTGTTGNTLTQTAPSGAGDQVQIVGHAISADIMMFNPDYTYVEIAA